ncbi:MAG: pyridoxal phosphate-dependent aminotransferase [Candidatus Eremiobacteraeota bacterium]|nr:pyridoxal phosphate-dependent aminotransferase [Candidatus Eremiobacteraeota bacterium]
MNPAISAGGESLIRELHGRRRPTSLNLGIGEPTLPPDAHFFEEATRWTAKHGCRYTTNIGDHVLREAIAAHYGYPQLSSPDNVCITNGSQEAVYLTMRAVVDPSCEEVLVVEPAFPVYVKIAQVEKIPLRRLDLDQRGGEGFDADAILEAVGPRTRLIVLCSPSNPTGRVISRATVQRIASALLGRGGPPVYILHDAIYRELVYVGDAGDFASVYPYTIAVNSLSKSNALPGLRLGWAIAPLEVMPSLVKLHGWVTSCASTFAQRVAFEIFAARALGAQQPWYAAQHRGVLAAVRETQLEYIQPEGAFYVCVRVTDGDALAFAETLLEERDVVAIPAHIFAPSLAGWVRTSYVIPLPEVCEGLNRIATLARERGLPEQTPSFH